MKVNDEIIARYLAGECTEEENNMMQSWLSEDAENQRILEQVYFAWKTTGLINIIEKAGIQEKLSALKKQVKNKERRHLLHKTALWMQRIAAVLFIPALLLSYYFYNRGSDEEMQYMEVRTNPGMISSVVLPDSSKVWINSCGYLKYPVRFTTENREVHLEGEGYFDVKKNDDSPFIVKVNDNYAVEVLGTEFNIKAYAEDEKIETTLVDGSVRINIMTEEKKQIRQILKPNQKGIYQDNTLVLEQIDPLYETSWIDGKMYFKNEPMAEVLKHLSRHYNVAFDVKKPEILESFITAKFESEQLMQVLEYLKLASNIKYKMYKPDISDERITRMRIELTK